ncbi:hypothetical protein BG011_005410 [Mortierella polycephala]|uniref:Uncharacterized protein n=1 Tax=Mortierella polycephala TaxID=41804 RepID=A0A9P6PYR6_9FUNG|nr:hypothetical protein BG011_005410 [Mortierella polycephala]
MSDVSRSSSEASSPRSLTSSASTDSLNQVMDRLWSASATPCPSSSNRRSEESRQRASRKKNQRRREVAKKNKALLNATTNTTIATTSSSAASTATEGTTHIMSTSDSSDHEPASSATSSPSSKTTIRLEPHLGPMAAVDNALENALTNHQGPEEKDKLETAPIEITLSEAVQSHSTLNVINLDIELPSLTDTLLSPVSSLPISSKEKSHGDHYDEETSSDVTWSMNTQTSNPSEQNSTTDCEETSGMVEHEPTEPRVIASTNINQDQSSVADQPSAETSHEGPSNDPDLFSWDLASETVATVALKCLTKDKDMELSYVAILSAMTVLQSKQDLDPMDDSNKQEHSVIRDLRKRVAGSYSQILQIMCRSSVERGLDKEILQQGIMAPEALYSQFYGSVQQAGYELEDGAHLAMAQYWIDHKKMEEALDCISRIDNAGWTGPTYRAAITCHLFSKPRQVHEAEALLQTYIERTATSQDQSKDSDAKARAWYKLQLDASKWEDIKLQYERRRIRLVDGPVNVDHIASTGDGETKLTHQALLQHQPLEQQGLTPRQFKHERSVSLASSTTSSSLRRSPSNHFVPGHQRSHSGQQRVPSVAPSWPSGASATLNTNAPAATTGPSKGAFSFLSSLKFTSKSHEADHALAALASLPSRSHVNHHLTVLDNSMLEECIHYKEFEYGWRNVYERMGPTLEDGNTAKTAMRLCRRAFLGHDGLAPNEPGSPNLAARDIYKEEGQDEAFTKAEHLTWNPELWEARAWVVYNKAMMNPHALLSSSSGSSTHMHASVVPIANGGNDTATATATSNSSHHSVAINSDANPLSMFQHDILTIAIHSPEISSRYLKAFKVYSAMRSDPHNHHQLRDPFVMACMIKAIYDAALSVVHNPEQQLLGASDQQVQSTKHQRRTSSISLNRSQPLTLGPLMDLAFEIYADMRNVGPIRHLPSLVNLTPTSPVGKTSRVPGTLAQLSAANSTASSSMVELSEIGTTSTVSTSPRSSFSVLSMPVFQELNPTLKPNPHARQLTSGLYLALLHLCIHVPMFKISSQVVKTIMDDMTAGLGRQLCPLDRHLAAALQCYHDTWMCSRETLASEYDSASGLEQHTSKCMFHEWMYKSDEDVKKHSAELWADVDAGASDTDSSLTELEKGVEEAQRSFGSAKQESCNDQLYWDLWSDEDPALQGVQFSREKGNMLWRHVAEVLL